MTRRTYNHMRSSGAAWIMRILLLLAFFASTDAYAGWTASPPPSMTMGNSTGAISASGSGWSPQANYYIYFWKKSPAGVWSGSAAGFAAYATSGSGTATFTPSTTGTWSVEMWASQSGSAGSSPSGYQLASGSITVNPAVTSVTFNFSGGPNFTYDGGTKTITATTTPGGGTFNQTGTWSTSSVGSYTATATAYGSYTGTGSYNWSIGKGNQTISFSNPGTHNYNDSFGLSASASSGLGVSFSVASGPATIAGSTLTVTGTGTITVTASQGGNSNWNAASDVSQSFSANALSTSFTFGSLSQQYNGSTKYATVTPSPAGATYTSSLSGGPSVGSYSVSATANGNYTGSGSATLTISKGDQSISFSNPGSHSVNDSFGLSASATSGLGVSFSVSSGPATIAGSTLTVTGTGTITVTASQGGNSNWNAASNVSQSFSASGISTSFTFGSLNQQYDGSTKYATVTPSPGGATYTSSLSGGPSAGSYTVSASAYGSYTGSGSATLNISRGDQSISFSNPGSHNLNDSFGLSASASSGLSVSFSVVSGPASIAGSTLTVTGVGTITVQASQGGNSNWNAAPNVNQSFTVSSISTTFTFGNLNQQYNGSTKYATVTPSPGGATYTSSLSGGPGVGSYTVSATANGSYAGSGSATLVISKGDQTISFTNPGGHTYGDAAFGLSATATSGLPVSFSVSSGPATIAGSTLTITGTGTVTVLASQAGNANWNAAPGVSQSFSVSAVPTTFTFNNLTYLYDGSAKSASVTANPSNATYTSTLTFGPAAGSYTVSATATGNYSGSGSAILNIITSSGTVVFNDAVSTSVAGPTTTTRTARISNIGTSALTVSAISYTGDFSSSNNAPIVITPSNSSDVIVKFTPTAVGVRMGTMQINSNSPTRPIIFFSLQGNGLNGAAAAPVVTITAATTGYTKSPFHVSSTATTTSGNITLHSIERMSPGGSWTVDVANASGLTSNRTQGYLLNTIGVWQLRAGASVDGGLNWVYSNVVSVVIAEADQPFDVRTMAVPVNGMEMWYSPSGVQQKTFTIRYTNP